MIVLISLFSSLLTFKFSHLKKIGTIRSSTILTLIFYTVIIGLRPWFDIDLEHNMALFFVASFVGMSCPNRVGTFGVIAGAIIYSGLFYLLVPLLTGFGGALGLSAFIGCFVAVSLKEIVTRKWKG